MNKKSSVGNGRSFYFNDDEKLELFYMQRNISCGKRNTSVIFVECTELIWNIKDSNGLCLSIFFKCMGWYLRVIGNIHNDECLIHIFTGGFINGTPNIFIYSKYR